MKWRGRRVPALTRPDGVLVPDTRTPHNAVPDWLDDPFVSLASRQAQTKLTPLETRYRGYKALSQRGRGGVYRARDTSTKPPRLCIIKEGRRHGEVSWDGVDGFARIRAESAFLKALSPTVTALPKVFHTFVADGSFHLAMEHIRGRSLHQIITSRKRIARQRLLRFCEQMARIVAVIHATGWAWRDCKPDNFLCGKNGGLRAIDFENACRAKAPPSRWGTAEYLPTGSRPNETAQGTDLYALGKCFMQLVMRTPKPPAGASSFKTAGTRQQLPREFIELAIGLTETDPTRRPSAAAVSATLRRRLRNRRR